MVCRHMILPFEYHTHTVQYLDESNIQVFGIQMVTVIH